MAPGTFRHEAMPYPDTGDLVGLVASFLEPALRAGDPALVVLDAAKGDDLRAALGPAGRAVTVCDVRAAGGNPAHLLPILRSFVDANAGRPLWGVSEGLWPGRSTCEVVEYLQHEVLLNSALADVPSFTLLCPFDRSSLPEGAVADAVDRHPSVRIAGSSRPNVGFLDIDDATLLADPLPAPPGDARVLPFTDADLPAVRGHVAAVAQSLGFSREQVGDVVLAVDEVATNSYRHGGGAGTLRTWEPDGGGLTCEIRDGGRFSDPMVGRRRPPVDQIGGRGLWIANQLCDLVQVRSTGAGTVVRLYARRDP